MTPKLVLTVIGSFQVAFAVHTFFTAGAVASDGIENISEQALWLGSTFVEVMAAMSLGAGFIYLMSRNIEASAARRVLTGAGLAYLAMVAVMVYHLVANADVQGGKPPMPFMIIFPVLAIWSLCVGKCCSTTDESLQQGE